jgi:hypothetical protein
MYDTLRNNTYFSLAFMLPATTLAAESDDNCCALPHFVQILFVLNGKGQHTVNLKRLDANAIASTPVLVLDRQFSIQNILLAACKYTSINIVARSNK